MEWQYIGNLQSILLPELSTLCVTMQMVQTKMLWQS